MGIPDRTGQVKTSSCSEKLDRKGDQGEYDAVEEKRFNMC